ncbi:MAG: endonuclease [Phycisphaeraceae bacterium]
MRLGSILFAAGLLWAAFTAPVAADAYAPPTGYYNAATGTGATLKNQLHNIIDDHTFLFYSEARSALQVTDRDPSDPSNIILVYDRASLDVSGLFASGIPGWDSGVSWNREHVWPRSRGINDDLGDDNSDLHNLRPADPQVNSDRGNFNLGGAFGQPFGLVSDGGTYWYPGDADAGMVARQAFYMAVRYDGSDSQTTNLELTNGNPGSFGTTMGNLARLIQWHYAAPPDGFERRRNDVIYDSYQGNRNPFIDRPEYVWSVFVDQNNDSRVTIFGGTTGINASQTSLTLDFGTALVGSTPAPATQAVTLLKAGDDGTYFEITPSGDATSEQAGRYNAFTTGGADTATISVGMSPDTASAGIKTASVTIDNLDVTTGGGTGRGNNDLDDLITTRFTVLDHINASFDGVADQNTLSIDFGQVPQASVHPGIGFDVFNLESTAGFTADMDIDNLVRLGSSAFDLEGLTGVVAAGTAASGLATLDTANLGSFGATWLIQVSDPDLPGETSQTIVLSLAGEVVAALLPGDTDNDGDIDDADLGTAFSNYTGPVGAIGNKTPADGDTDNDGDIDDSDLGTAFANYTGPLAPANVPEPSTAAVLIILLGGVRHHTHRRA